MHCQSHRQHDIIKTLTFGHNCQFAQTCHLVARDSCQVMVAGVALLGGSAIYYTGVEVPVLFYTVLEPSGAVTSAAGPKSQTVQSHGEKGGEVQYCEGLCTQSVLL